MVGYPLRRCDASYKIWLNILLEDVNILKKVKAPSSSQYLDKSIKFTFLYIPVE